MKKRIVIGAIVAAAAVFGVCAGIMAAGTLGTRDDPLVTLSYLNERFKPELAGEFEEKIAARGAELSAKVDAYVAGLPPAGGEAAAAPENAFALVTLAKGGAIIFGEGAEVLPREGAAVFAGEALPDATAGESLARGAVMPLNHLYIIAADGDGIRADTEDVRLLVRGEYELAS
ncbi:MAG: hypothetical protein LBD49_02320 [Oscillospiraceae bacterium]|jgi:hypothetical protein|nr:hypothetical protein [Oscillospiraceae bacterium]